MIKLKDVKYRNAIKTIMERDWMNSSDKFWAMDTIIQVMIHDPESRMNDLKIAQRVRWTYK